MVGKLGYWISWAIMAALTLVLFIIFKEPELALLGLIGVSTYFLVFNGFNEVIKAIKEKE